ncbi:ubiquitin-conjugating enzyme E2, putative [Theileria annulata]|uniref:Ubiquitin-conjugating enzyme E2, putative n=1 Tax=Theileria annulata TaxID=5874 RepID=Q4U8F2_THEAN|nr:ubiquitin-conjugating enzyme E2, putative [Theileria annulata]CAI76901.1 ubiquitin-conjugating enzyme E2, putative [Theileria annulata]|eukprot:XP_953526.1 ubiquitin-conjugating enzyme E2, putative [Theileria annulata]
MSIIARELLKRQFLGTLHNNKITRDVNSMFSVGLEDDNYFKWRVCFEGPSETPYEGGIFTVIMTFPEDFPNNPPEMFFKNQMWHPNIYPDGRVCISILHPPGSDRYNEQELPNERWRPILGVETILISVISMLGEPNLESPANVDAGVQLKNDPKEYRKKVKMLTRKTLE